MPIIYEITNEQHTQALLDQFREDSPLCYHLCPFFYRAAQIMGLFAFELSVFSIGFSIAQLHFYKLLCLSCGVLCAMSLVLSALHKILFSFGRSYQVTHTINHYFNEEKADLNRLHVRGKEVEPMIKEFSRDQSKNTRFFAVDRYAWHPRVLRSIFDIRALRGIDQEMQNANIHPHKVFVSFYKERFVSNPDLQGPYQYSYYLILTIATPQFKQECERIIDNNYYPGSTLPEITNFIFMFAFNDEAHYQYRLKSSNELCDLADVEQEEKSERQNSHDRLLYC